MGVKDYFAIISGKRKLEFLLRQHKLNAGKNMLLAYQCQEPAAVPYPFLDAAIFQPAVWLDRSFDYEEGEDKFGVKWRFDQESWTTVPVENDPLLQEISSWKEVVHFPDLDAINWKNRARHDLKGNLVASYTGMGYQKLGNGRRATDGGKGCICELEVGLLDRLCSLMGGLDRAKEALEKEPQECAAFLEALADWKISFIKKIHEAYPVDVIWFHDELAQAEGMRLSVDIFRSLIAPPLKKIIDAVHREGLVFQLCTGGKVSHLIPELISLKADAIGPLDPSVNPDLKKQKEKYGKYICFVGGFSLAVLDRRGVTDEEIKEEYRRVVRELAPGGSYIAYTGSKNPNTMVPLLSAHYEVGLHIYGN